MNACAIPVPLIDASPKPLNIEVATTSGHVDPSQLASGAYPSANSMLKRITIHPK
eukprot:CAMPEP_0181191836 /NCGR_PEP_ID=MMETSP1096-20121128/12947_1 /TAXON_ID=156174 ORGANISM="Chrysochromulina ericina, Strain CCMP281" /NCGR_SAMPLE_ID=MMETSP1096 /ASSEMBLY_ACC=CAM_ASM_000453 /LENGTH=54 /DNA_ID=CAMNT_0023281161 /DNA_START=886 /DNA_END=1050 /DNA_ORIENTATION=-